MDSTPDKTLTRGQALILGGATIPMVVFGGLGGWGTYTNITTVFHRSATALGVVAAGEGATLILALVMVGLTLLGQSSPTVVRIGLWTLPAAASGTGAFVAANTTDAVVFAITPMAMCVSAEGMGLLARRIVVYRTGVDIEAQRRNAVTMQRLSVQRALAANHPEEKSRKRAERKSWRLARKVGRGDDGLGANFVTVQRDRMTAGADAALAGMFAGAVPPAVTAAVTPALALEAGRDGSVTAPVTESAIRHTATAAPVTDPAALPPAGPPRTGGVTMAVTQVSGQMTEEASHRVVPVTDADRDGVTGPATDSAPRAVTDAASVTGHTAVTLPGGVTDPEPSRALEMTVTLEQVAVVAGVPTPLAGERLSNQQLVVVLRHLRYREDPPLSYRQAATAFRNAGFVGGERRVRRTWAELMSKEDSTTQSSHCDDGMNLDEEDEEEAGPHA
ncbi:hypothetical protein [Streptomyces sp. H39-C1]|uniref:hypothetical protein n=1 Tax=Streptomyces sp. H39-C1 TaxID=3004355 RepID=UPI0022B03424|nr:hypothetical protein [Streptomyces sp. H39-C1]MCZ4098023.1 hypothetical protein [Streptomyces sp. H39-C1]